MGTDAAGAETWTLTPMGEQVATHMVMSGADDDAQAVLDALLGAGTQAQYEDAVHN
jgi:hypothetical protein